MSNILQFVPRCSICKKRPATKLCDFPIATVQYVGHGPRAYHLGYDPRINPRRVITCSKPICDKCSVKSGNFDFCRTHKGVFENGK